MKTTGPRAGWPYDCRYRSRIAYYPHWPATVRPIKKHSSSSLAASVESTAYSTMSELPSPDADSSLLVVPDPPLSAIVPDSPSSDTTDSSSLPIHQRCPLSLGWLGGWWRILERGGEPAVCRWEQSRYIVPRSPGFDIIPDSPPDKARQPKEVAGLWRLEPRAYKLDKLDTERYRSLGRWQAPLDDDRGRLLRTKTRDSQAAGDHLAILGTEKASASAIDSHALQADKEGEREAESKGSSQTRVSSSRDTASSEKTPSNDVWRNCRGNCISAKRPRTVAEDDEGPSADLGMLGILGRNIRRWRTSRRDNRVFFFLDFF